MAKVRKTFALDETLMREVRVRAARLGASQSEMVERVLREGLGIIDTLRAKANLDEEEAVRLASEVVHEVRAGRPDRTP